jgi:hypothetical protein
MDGGIVEGALLNSMMTGAAVGGGSSLLQGKDPLQGALLGGLMGGAVSGISGLMPGAEAATAATPAAGAAPASTVPAVSPSSFSVAPTDMTAYAPTPTQYGAFGEAPGSVLSGNQTFGDFGQAPDITGTAPVSDAEQQAASKMFGSAAKPPVTQPQGFMGKAGEWWDSLTPKQQLLTGGAGIAGLGIIHDQMRGGVPQKDPYSGQLSRFKYNPDTYRSYFSRGFAAGGDTGGIASLGSYSDGGRMLKGPGDGMSDNIPATISGKQPARLADGEFVVPADVVSHLGNGSTDAGAKQLYSMMNKVRQARTGNPKQGKQIQPRKYLPA